MASFVFKLERSENGKTEVEKYVIRRTGRAV